jgi:hypothetical protein
MSNEQLLARALLDIYPPLHKAADEWKYVDHFTVRQVAYLWGDNEPMTDLDTKAHNRPSQLNAVIQMLISAITAGTLHATKKYDLLPVDEQALVGRADLVKFCEAKSQFPEFLFDTRPKGETMTSQANVASQDNQTGPSFAEKDGGRRRTYNWDRIAAAAVVIEWGDSLVDEHGQPLHFMAICRRLKEFVQNGYSIHEDPNQPKVPAPDISQIQKYCGGFLKEFIALRNEHEKRKSIGKIIE